MPAFLLAILPLLSNLLPYVIGAAAIMGLYFGVKRKGVLQERARAEEAVLEVKRETEKRVDQAKAQDLPIDERVRKQVEEIKKLEKQPEPADSYRPGDIFRF